MAFLAHLWLPILLSAVFVFLASSLIHMVFKWHSSDYRALPNEEAVRAAFAGAKVAPGQYVLPHCTDMKARMSPEMQQKYAEGPVGLLHLVAPGMPAMGPAMAKWFLYNLAVAFLVAYVAAHALEPGVHYLQVFRVAGTVGFLTYAGGLAQASIWAGKPWSITLKEMVDSLIYGLVVAGTFGWLWPR